MLEPVKNTKLDLIVANLPHASKKIFKEKPYLSLEPREGTYSGETGLELIERFLKDLSSYKFLNHIKAVFLKITPKRSSETIQLVQKHTPSLKIDAKKDSEGETRYLVFS